MANLTKGPRASNGLIWLRVLELNLDKHPTGRVIAVPLVTFTRERDIYGGRWRMPVVPARHINEKQLAVKCPYCGHQHLHGLGAGHRVAECGLGVGYVLREAAA